MRKWVAVFVLLIAKAATAAISSTERDALIALYNATGGASWKDNSGWLGAAGTECSWLGVHCDPSQSRVVALELVNNGLSGSIPSQVSGLLSLESLTLTGNQLTGPISTEIAAVSTLRSLQLSSNRLTGTIPVELRTLRNLAELDLSFNMITGSIPAVLGDLVNLEILALAGNRLTGTIPIELTGLLKLRELNLGFNQIGGPIPPELSRLRELRRLELWFNRLTGTLPVSIATLPHLEYLNVWSNELTGSIPPELGSMMSLREIYLTSNHFSGEPPDTFASLTALEALGLSNNQLTGPIPSWIAGMKSLTFLTLDSNRFTGAIPSFFWTLSKLRVLGFSYNRLTGSLPPDIRNLKELTLLSFSSTAMSGPLPPEIGELTNLESLFASDAGLTGPLPREFGNLTALDTVFINWNELEGPLPPEIGNLRNVIDLYVDGNRFSGPLPPELGNLPKVTTLWLSDNALRGAIPQEITKLTTLRTGGLNINYNALFTNDAGVRDFVNSKYFSDVHATQTLTPANLRVTGVTDRSVSLQWERIAYTFGDGGYQVAASLTPGGPAVAVATTDGRHLDNITLRNLSPETTYHFTVSSVAYPHFKQKNLLISDPSPAVSATTTARVLAPPVIEMTEQPTGLIQVEGVPLNEDHFTLTNFGDRPSSISIRLEADFVTLEPRTFTLQPGASQVVVVKSISRPIETYYGFAIAEGEGTGPGGIFIWLTLLSAAKPTGTVRAEPVDTRVELAGVPGSDSVGQARFRNVGTASLSGIVVSDQPWVVPEDRPVHIPPGLVGEVTFRVVRSRRPPGAEGALTANLSLIYVDVGISDFARGALQNPPGSGVSVAKVTVVDVSKPALSSSTIPPGGPSEIGYFLPGVASFVRAGTSFVSDVSLLNNAGGRSLSDVRLYYTPSGADRTTVASLSAIPATQSVTLANVVTNVYGVASQVGSLQIRSNGWDDLVVQAKLLGLAPDGSFAGDVPVFRSDRSVPAREKLYLAGVRKSASLRSDLYIQETDGFEANAQLEFLDSNGNAVGESRSVSVGRFGVVELVDAVPASATSVVITNSGSFGKVAAYARVLDEGSGESWSVIDWSRYNAFKLGESMRIPYVDGAGETQPGRGKRRAAAHAVTTPSRTDVTLFNPSALEVRAVIQVVDSAGAGSRNEVALGPRQTLTLSNVGANTKSTTAQIVITPVGQGELLATARTTRATAKTAGASVPVVAAATGLRLGRSQIFANLDDSTLYQTSFGLVETSNGSAVVRARIFLDEGRSLASSAIYRDFQVAPGQQIMVDELVRAIVGASRDSLGDLHNLQLRVEVLSGNGSVVPFVIITDKATGDSLLRLE